MLHSFQEKFGRTSEHIQSMRLEWRDARGTAPDDHIGGFSPVRCGRNAPPFHFLVGMEHYHRLRFTGVRTRVESRSRKNLFSQHLVLSSQSLRILAQCRASIRGIVRAYRFPLVSADPLHFVVLDAFYAKRYILFVRMSDEKWAEPLMERRNPKVLAQILDATFECLARQGSMSISLREIAKHAGVALSQLHYYFDSKENLLAEAVLYKTRKIIQELRSELHTAPSLEERIHQFGQFLRSDRVLGSDWQKVYFDLLSSSIWVPRMAEAMRSVQEEMLQVVLADDQLRIMNRSEARLILAALDGLALQYLQGAPDEELQTAYELLGKALIRLRG